MRPEFLKSWGLACRCNRLKYTRKFTSMAHTTASPHTHGHHHTHSGTTPTAAPHTRRHHTYSGSAHTVAPHTQRTTHTAASPHTHTASPYTRTASHMISLVWLPTSLVLAMGLHHRRSEWPHPVAQLYPRQLVWIFLGLHVRTTNTNRNRLLGLLWGMQIKVPTLLLTSW